ncbi:alpha/beta fold hydrolase [Streptomyces sp. NPDC051985]|uniref:alpha/beta fold hydrolase n=1 Tax=Streptomyces sp. NPDC051985 TaxID=3155807 RepID=UPI00342DAB5C
MATFVLVHGGYHGGWAYRDVVQGLRSEGHDVFTPTLTGLGERRHLLSSSVTPQVHATDLTNMLFYEDLRDVVLVGHSYGGVPITVAAGKTDRIGELIYLDAMVPKDGQCFFDLVPPEMRDYIAGMRDESSYPVVPGFEGAVPDWAAPRLTPQPASELDRPIPVSAPASAQLPRTYLQAGKGPSMAKPGGDWVAPWFDEVQSPPWRFTEYDGDHEVMLTDPDRLVRLLLAAVAEEPSAAQRERRMP